MVVKSSTRQDNNGYPLYRVTILGAGAWGSVLADLAIANHHAVTLWSRRLQISLEAAVRDADVIISALSMKGVPDMVAKLRSRPLPKTPIWVTATKGLNPETFETPSQLWGESFPKHSVVVLSGPNLAGEIIQGLPAATVVSSENVAAALQIQALFNSERFRVYTNLDPLGTELGGTLKNVMAIAAGVCDGLNLGTNAKSALLTRALPEMIQIGQLFGAQPETFWGLSGLGDLMATCSSPLSRNYRVGYGLGTGKSLPQVLAEIGSTAEGVNTTQVLVQLAAQKKIEIPIAQRVAQLLEGTIPMSELVKSLMGRQPKSETLFES